MPCSHDQCQVEPRWRPVVELRVKRSEAPLRVRFLRLGYCNDHRYSLGIQVFLSDEGIDKLAKFVREKGRGEVDRRGAALSWEELSPADQAAVSESHDRTESDETLSF